MYMRAVTIRIVYLGVLSLGILCSLAFRQSVALAAPTHTSTAQTSRSAAALPVMTLPTVQVRAQAQRDTVPALPSVAIPAMAEAPAHDHHPPRLDWRDTSLPTLRWETPHYSFGKMLPRVGKE